MVASWAVACFHFRTQRTHSMHWGMFRKYLLATWDNCQSNGNGWIVYKMADEIKKIDLEWKVKLSVVGFLIELLSVSHYCDAIMGTVASQITSLTIVYTTVYSDADQSKHQSSASLAFVWGIHRGPVNSPHKWPVTRIMFPFDDVIMDDESEVPSTLSPMPPWDCSLQVVRWEWGPQHTIAHAAMRLQPTGCLMRVRSPAHYRPCRHEAAAYRLSDESEVPSTLSPMPPWDCSLQVVW